jgi:hypothetical protein
MDSDSKQKTDDSFWNSHKTLIEFENGSEKELPAEVL